MAWCGNNYLYLNVNMTKEMILDFKNHEQVKHIELRTVSIRGTITSVFMWTTDWTGDGTLMLSTGRDRADFTS